MNINHLSGPPGQTRPRSAGLRPGALTHRVAGVLTAIVLSAGLLLGGVTTSAFASPAKASALAAAPAAPTASLVATVTGATPGTCPTSNTTSFAKTKFVLHTGLAFGAFHRYLYKPFRAGSFASGAHGRIVAFVKAGLAAVFIEHEVRLAAGDVEGNPTLCKVIAAPMRSLYASVGGAISKLRHGDTSGVKSAQGSLSSVESSSSGGGAKIQENPNPNIGG